ELQLAALAPLLRDRGVEIAVFTRAMDEPGRYVERGTEIYRLSAPGPRAAASLAFTLNSARRLSGWRPTVVHAHELLSPATAALLAKRLLGVPVVAKVLSSGSHVGIAKLKRSAHGRRRLAALVRGVDAFAVISRDIDAELSCEGVPEERRRLIPNGVDIARFARTDRHGVRERFRSRLGVADDTPVALFCGRLVPEKRIWDLASAWTSSPLAREAELWVAGAGPLEERFRDNLPGVRYLGLLEDVAPAVQAADLYVQPSAQEGLSNSMLEAMAAGMPVLATDVGGGSDLLSGTGAGVLVPADGVADLVRAASE